jgi:hypothetical protein
LDLPQLPQKSLFQLTEFQLTEFQLTEFQLTEFQLTEFHVMGTLPVQSSLLAAIPVLALDAVVLWTAA